MNLFDIVKKHIDELDIYSLFAAGAPDDEYDIESEMICADISADSSEEDIARAAAAVFERMFSRKYRPEDFAETAARIRSDIANQG